MVNLSLFLALLLNVSWVRSEDKVIALNQVGGISMLLYDSGIIDCDTLICPRHTFKCIVDQRSNYQDVKTDRRCYDNGNRVILEKSEVSRLTRSQSTNSKMSASLDKNGVVSSNQSSIQGNPIQFVDHHESRIDRKCSKPNRRTAEFLFEESLNFRQNLLRRIRNIYKKIRALRQKFVPFPFVSDYLRNLAHDN